MTSESNKQKIAKIHDMFPTATKDTIAKILQYYEDDDSKAIDAMYRDGGIEAVSNWAESGNLKSKNNKSKKKKKKGRRESDLTRSATASFDADDSSSLHSGGNVDVDVEKECSVVDSRNGIYDSVEEMKESQPQILNMPEIDGSNSFSKDLPTSKSDVEGDSDTGNNTCGVSENDSKSSRIESANPTCISPVSNNSDKQEDISSRKERYKTVVKEDSHGKHSSRQRTNSFRRSKAPSFSEDSTNIHNPAVPTKRGYEKCKKDLNRQSISLQRIHSQVDKGLEESAKKIKTVFNEVKKLLDKRQEELEQELDRTKEDALKLLKSRQDLAVELKKRVDRTPSLTECQWSELRSDVKQFVTERKYDDELGKTIWFQWSMDAITNVISTFGEVHPVKNVYSQRSHSALGNVSSLQNNPEPSPSSSLANEEIGSATDKNDVADIGDTVEEEPTIVKKDVPPPIPRSHPPESRSRVFSNTKFQNNRARGGGYRGGNRNYGYSRPNNRNIGVYRSNYVPYEDYRSSDYRGHSHQEYSNDRSINNHRNNRRGNSNINYRNNSRFRGNMNQQRHNNNANNNDSVSKMEPMSNECSALDSEKSNIVNGFMNN